MKTKTETKEITSTLYTCEGCGKEEYEKINIEICERQHKCKHEKFTHDIDGHTDYDGHFETASISRSCIDCGQELGGYLFDKQNFEEKVF